MKIFFISEIIALSCGIIAMFIRKNSYLNIFVPFLAITVLYEYGSFSGWFTINDSNLWAFNLFATFEFIFYLSVFILVFRSKKTRWRIAASLVIFILFFCLNNRLGQGFFSINSYTIIFGSVLIVGWCCFIFYEMLRKDDRFPLAKRSIFWICVGLFIFYLFQFAFMLHFHYMVNSEDYRYAKLFRVVTDGSNLILYVCMAIGLLCQRSCLTKL